MRNLRKYAFYTIFYTTFYIQKYRILNS